MLALLGSYAQADLIAAVERAVRYGAYSHAAVERILSAQARPRTILEVLAEEERRQYPPGWVRTWCLPGRRRSTNTSASRNPTMLRNRPPRPVTPAPTELRRQIIEDFQAMRAFLSGSVTSPIIPR